MSSTQRGRGSSGFTGAETGNAVVVNADDLGLSREVNEGIFKGIEQGVISDASLLINAPHVDDALWRLRERGLLHLGLHISLDRHLGWDLPGAERYERDKLMSLFEERDFIEGCRSSVRSQIEGFLHAGLIPTHVDTHHHEHGFFPVFSLIVGLMKEYRIPAMRFSRRGYTLTSRKPIPFHAPAYRKMGEILAREGIFFCEAMVEGANRLPDIRVCPAELVVHPSLGGDPWRAGELEALLSEGFSSECEGRGIRLVSYRDLVDGRRGS